MPIVKNDPGPGRVRKSLIGLRKA